MEDFYSYLLIKVLACIVYFVEGYQGIIEY